MLRFGLAEFRSVDRRIEGSCLFLAAYPVQTLPGPGLNDLSRVAFKLVVYVQPFVSAQHKLPIAFIDMNGGSIRHVASQDFIGQRVLQIFLHRAF